MSVQKSGLCMIPPRLGCCEVILALESAEKVYARRYNRSESLVCGSCLCYSSGLGCRHAFASRRRSFREIFAWLVLWYFHKQYVTAASLKPDTEVSMQRRIAMDVDTQVHSKRHQRYYPVFDVLTIHSESFKAGQHTHSISR
jgi:hypothetical protein